LRKYISFMPPHGWGVKALGEWRARCALCGEPLRPAEALASKYACLATCTPITRAPHLHARHKSYLREAGRVAPPITYSFLGLCSVTLPLLLASQHFLATLTLALALTVLAYGTYARLRLLARHRARAYK
jgi:hypothetical protein